MPGHGHAEFCAAKENETSGIRENHMKNPG